MELDPKHLAVGEANARLNGLPITFVQGFAGKTPLPPTPFKTLTSGEVPVPRVSVQSLMENRGIDELNILHCDIQGAEFEVLQGCQQLFLDRRIEFLFVSTHYFGPEFDPLIHQRCLALILNCGGKIIAEHDIHESFSCDGLIVAFFGDNSEKATPVPVSFNRYSQAYFRNPLYDVAIMRRCG